MVRRHGLETDPGGALKGPKRARLLPTVLTKDEAVALAQHTPESPHCPAEAARNKALLEVLYGAGLRISEAMNLDVGDVAADSPGAMVKVRREKRQKEGFAPLRRMGWEVVQRYLFVRSELGAGPELRSRGPIPGPRRTAPRSTAGAEGRRSERARGRSAEGVPPLSPAQFRHALA